MIEKLKELIPNVKSFLQAENESGICRKTIKKLCDKNNINYSHFKTIFNKPKYIDKEFFNLTIKEIYSIKLGKYNRCYAECLCKCGKIKSLRFENVITGKTKSCGCLSKRREKMDGNNNPSFKGVGDIPSSWLNNFKFGAEKRNIGWNLSINEVYELYKKQNGKCALSGEDLFFGRIRYRLETNASIDRVDSNGIYEICNIQLVTKNINIMKQTMTQQEFIKLCKLVAQNN